MSNKKISTKPYKGTKDYYPIDMFKRNYLFNIWEKVAKQFGYEEYDNPILENAQLYRAKSGDELSNQLYNFTDKGGREVAIKPEMTPSLARMIADKGGQIVKPIRWFNISKYYRYEKPQKGRTREFFQLNIDIFGIETIEAEAELFQFIENVMKELKAPKDSYTLFVNNRFFMDYIFENVIGIEKEKYGALAKALDNYTKLEQNDFIEYLADIGLDKQQVDDTLAFLKSDINDVKQYKGKSKGADELLKLFDILDKLNISNVEFKPYIVRGLAYYTGTVFEMFDTGGNENPRALFGGGRYDDLLDLFNMDRLPAVGLGWGSVTMLDYMETYNLIPEYSSETEIFISLEDSSFFEYTSKIAKALRDNGIKVQQQLVKRSMNKQWDYAKKKGFTYMIMVGEDEIKDNTIILKNLIDKTQEVVKVKEIVSELKG